MPESQAFESPGCDNYQAEESHLQHIWGDQDTSCHGDERVIAVLGATGTGKSTFINLVSGSNLAVGEDLTSCTAKVETANTFELFGKLVTLVDTPGFDDTTVSDTDILKMIAVYLSSTYENGYKLSGIIYMHRISDFRMGGISRRNLNMFRKLCGDEALGNVVVVTNMWGEVTPERGAAREHQLRTDERLFAPVLQGGATMLRHDNTYESAQAILAHLVGNRPRALRIQRELVDEGRDIAETAAGAELGSELEALRKRHAEELAEIREEMKQALAEKDERMRKELEQVRNELLQKIKKIERDRDRLSREYAEKKAEADERVRKIQEGLKAEKAEREERQREAAPSVNKADKSPLNVSTVGALQRLTANPRGFFALLGRAIESMFGH